MAAKIPLGVEVGNGWIAYEGLLGGPGPLGSVVFRHEVKRSEMVAGVDLDKRVLVSSELRVSEVALTSIVQAMNIARRRLQLELLAESA